MPPCTIFGLSQSHALRMDDTIDPIRDRTSLILTVYPGDTSAYARWEPFHSKCLPLARAALADPLHCCIASLELAWRLYEFALESGQDVESVASVDGAHLLEHLAARASALGHPEAILAECALNRYCMPRSGSGSYATDSPIAVALLVALGEELGVDDGFVPSEPSQEAIAFYLFDQLLPADVRYLSPAGANKIAELMRGRSGELDSLRKKCRSLAQELTASPPDQANFASCIRAQLDGLQTEVSDIINVDAATVKGYFRELSEDPKTWAALGGLLGSAVGLPELVTAAGAITALSTIGAQAVKSSNRRHDKLRESPWSFLYYASR
jgi:hypothetical protein